MKPKHLLTVAVFAAGMSVGPVANAATIDLGFAVDQSGSIGSSNYTLVKTALANALDQIPTSGVNEYRIAVVKFDSSATTVITPTVVTAANIASLKATISGMSYSGGGTAIDAGVTRLTSLFTTAGLGDTTLFNVTTDGQSSASNLQAAATAAYGAGVDGLSYEGIGGGVSTATLLSASFPGTPVLVTQAANLPNPTTTGFVFTVATFADYEAAIKAKVGRVVIDTGGGTGAVPLPAALPMLLSGFGALGGLGALRRRAKKAA